MLGLGDARMKRPLDEKDEAWLVSFATDIINSYPPESFPHRMDRNITNWSRESYDIAIAYVYDGIEPDMAPSNAYIRRGQGVAKRQIALAGYRLANLLNELYGES